MGKTLIRWIRQYQLLAYVVLAYGITYAAGYGMVLLQPGRPMTRYSLVWVLNVSGPTLAALIIGWVIGGRSEVKRLLSGFTRWRVRPFWYVAAAFLLLGPLAIALVYRAVGEPGPGLQPGATIWSLLGTALFTLLSGPLSEELGWRGFALPRLQARHSALVASLILGTIWCFWHLPLFYIPGESQMAMPIPIYWVLVVTIAVYLTWLWNNTGGSLIITVLAHFCFNMTGFLTGPLGLMSPMRLNMIAGGLLAAVVVAVVVAYGPRSLSRKTARELPFRRRVAHARRRRMNRGLTVRN